MAELFGLTGEHLIFYKAQTLASGDFHFFKMDEAEALEYFKKLCRNLLFDEMKAETHSYAMYLRCQNRLLEQENLPSKLLQIIPTFSEFGRRNLTRLIQAWEDGGEEALEKTFWEIFSGNWEEIKEDFEPINLKLLELRRAAFGKYETVQRANHLFDQIGVEKAATLSPEEFLEKLEIRITRPGLTDGEKVGLVICTAACGRWESMKSTRDNAFDIIKSYCQSADVSAETEEVVKRLYFSTQHALMSFRRDDFYEIQEEPPFSKFGYENMLKFLTAWRESGKESLEQAFNQIFSDGWEERVPEQKIVEILGGDGKTQETAIKFSTSEMFERIRAEFWYAYYLFGKDWSHSHFSIVGHEGKSYSLWSLDFSDGTKKKIYFDKVELND